MAYTPMLKRYLKRRINILRGQLTAITLMVEQGEEVQKVLNQTKSIHHSLASLEQLLLEDHLKFEFPQKFKYDEPKAVQEIVKLFKK